MSDNNSNKELTESTLEKNPVTEEDNVDSSSVKLATPVNQNELSSDERRRQLLELFAPIDEPTDESGDESDIEENMFDEPVHKNVTFKEKLFTFDEEINDADLALLNELEDDPVKKVETVETEPAFTNCTFNFSIKMKAMMQLGMLPQQFQANETSSGRTFSNCTFNIKCK